MPSGLRTAFIYTPRFLEFDYGPGHPLRNERLELTYDLISACELLPIPSARYVEPEPATDEELLVFLKPDYLNVLKAADAGHPPLEAFRYGLGTSDNPILPGIYRWSALVAGASLLAMRLVESGEVRTALNISGGLHHAGPGSASGFCYINDAALIIADLCRRGHRVAYVDIDAHHGDGVQWAFYDTDQVLTLSIHESGHTLFPGTGFVEELGEGKGEGYSVNIPLPSSADDEIFLWCFNEVIPPLIDAFQPDILVTQLGIDAHRTDPLSHVGISLGAFVQTVRRLKGVCDRWVALGGGGYDLRNVARAWTAAWAIMNDREPPALLPESFLARHGGLGFSDLTFIDAPAIIEGKAKARAWEEARETVGLLRQLVFPRHGI
ncbi:acetoin utilization protein AcuC [Candidatus Methylomirabilis sp.]|uniref:acetoin utilization protein AcuC n=1 Tax=Candidatus Methylomirabilis sp. TaxID=2032687 RepID=UPI002A5BB8A9|nr:acetoin utilization protein AcuC [Candidatus Methylomirabilis sp.]